MSAPALPYLALTPLFLLVGGALAVMLLEAFFDDKVRPWIGWISAAVVAGALALLLRFPELTPDATGTLVTEPGTYVGFGALVLLGALAACLLAIPYLGRHRYLRGEFFALVLFSASGGLLLAAARDLVLLFLAVEILTVPLYVLAGYYRTRRRGMEAAIKYFLVGVFCSAFLLYGIALFYGSTGTLDLEQAREAWLAGSLLDTPVLRLSLAMMLVGIGFKIAAVPFHFWAPDVYQAAPTPVTLYLAEGSKAGGFALAWKVLVLGFPALASVWAGALTLLAAATLVVGALLAMLQEDLKRLLAWSSVASAGYGLIALAAQGRLLSGTVAAGPGPSGTEALLVYLLVYAFNVAGAFAVVGWMERSYGGPVTLEAYEGLARRNPGIAALLAVFLLSLAGMPPAAGFVSKYVLFWSAVRAGAWTLAVVGVLTAVVGMYYYLSVVVAMYFRPARRPEPGARPALSVGLVLLVCIVAVALLGVWPGPVLELLEQAGRVGTFQAGLSF